MVEALESRLFLSVSIGNDQAHPIGIEDPIKAVSPNSGGLSSPPSSAKTPAQLRGAYGLGQYGSSNITFNGVQGDGSGQTIAIIDAYDDPNAQSDLHNFDLAFGLPDAPIFEKVNEYGSQTTLPATDPGGPNNANGTWEEEESLDIESAHALAPKANIILVETNSESYEDLFQGINWARYQPGVSVISMSWGGSEDDTTASGQPVTSLDSDLTTPAGHPGITFIASTGDSGRSGGIEYPAISPNVLAVGGTTLTMSSSNHGTAWASETGWSGSGGGVSATEAAPSYQIGVVSNALSGGMRTIPDVASEANPSAPGVALYDSWDFGTSTPWLNGYEGGTSLSAPTWAGLIAVADQGRAISNAPSLDGRNDTLPAIYSLHASSTDFHDITSGSNGFSAKTGYDLVTGIGTPIANNLIPGLLAIDTAPVITSFTASPQPVTSQSANVTLNVTATNSPSEVDYYIESNDIPGFQTGSGGDTEIGISTTPAGGFTYTISGGYGTVPSGNFTFYAVAKNSFGPGQTAVADSNFTAGTGTAPTIGSLTATASPAAATSITLTVNSLSDSQGAVNDVKFWRESNGIPGLQVGPGGDTLVGSTTAPSGSNWSVISTAPTAAGTYTYYAQSTDVSSPFPMSSVDGTSAVSASVTVVAGPASQLAFAAGPANSFAGVTLPAVVLDVEDQYGNLVTGDGSPVTLTLNGGSFASGSTTTVNAVGGVATFSNLSINATGSFSVTASDGSLPAITSPVFTISSAVALSALVTTGGATTAIPGQAAVITVTIANGSQVSVSGATVSDFLPSGITSDTFIASDNGLGATGYTTQGTGNISDTVNLPAGAIITYSINATISPLASGSLTDIATVSTPSGTVNGNANVNGSTQANQNSATLSLTPQADTYVALSGSDPLSIGGLDVYTIVVTNNGLSAITGTPGTTGLTVADTFPNLTGVTYTSQVLFGTAAGNTQNATPASSLALADVLTMGVDAIVQYTVTGTVTADAPSTVTDTVTITVPAGTTDPNLADNTSSVSASVSPGATASVLDRTLFYGDSTFDGNNSAAPSTADFNAIPYDKVPLMPGQTATFNNYSGYVDGINGIFVDLSGEPQPANISAADFEFIVGNNSSPGTGSSPGSNWSILPSTSLTVVTFAGQGASASDRIALQWPNGTIAGKWVQVTVLADANTGLATPDVFYFGSAPGDSGNSTTDAHVNATDEVQARNDPHSTFANPAPISDPNDYSRDARTNATDEVIARNHSTNFSNALSLITAPGLPNNAGQSAPAGVSSDGVSSGAVSSPSASLTVALPQTGTGQATAAPAIISSVPHDPAPAKGIATASSKSASVPIIRSGRKSATSINATPAQDQQSDDAAILEHRLKSLLRLMSGWR